MADIISRTAEDTEGQNGLRRPRLRAAEKVAAKGAKEKPAQNGQVSAGGRGNAGGTAEAARKLGVPRSTLQRALKATEAGGDARPDSPAETPKRASVTAPPRAVRPHAPAPAPEAAFSGAPTLPPTKLRVAWRDATWAEREDLMQNEGQAHRAAA